MKERMQTPELEVLAPHVRTLMQILAVPKILTDQLAQKLLGLAGVTVEAVDAFLKLLRCTNFMEVRNDEWVLESSLRGKLLSDFVQQSDRFAEINELLYRMAFSAAGNHSGNWPRYIFTAAGKAYHCGASGKVDEALRFYGESAESRDSGELWLAGKLAAEQQYLGILPKNAQEPAFLLALSLYREGLLEEAAAQLDNVLTSEHRTLMLGRAWMLHGEIEAEFNHLPKAISSLTQAVELFTELDETFLLIQAYKTRSLVYRRWKKMPQALSDISAAIELAHGDRRARLLSIRAGIHKERGDLPQALNDLNDAETLAKPETLFWLLNQRAGVNREMNANEAALLDLDKAVQLTEHAPDAGIYNTRASVLADLGDFESAAKNLVAAEQYALPEQRAPILSTRASIRLAQGDVEGCLADLQIIIEMPEYLWQNVDISLVRTRKKNVEPLRKALAAARTEDEIRSRWFKYYLTWASSGVGLNRFRRIEIYRRALLFSSSDAQASQCYAAIGMRYEAIGEFDRALEYLAEAERLAPESGRVIGSKARVLHQIGAPYETVALMFKKSLEASQNNAWVMSWYALLEKDAGHLEFAEQLAREAVEIDSNPVVLYNLAVVLYAFPDLAHQQQSLDVAERAARKALKSFSEPRKLVARIRRELRKR